MELRRIYINDILYLGGSVSHLKTIRKTPFSILAECSVVLGNIKVNTKMRTYRKGGGYLLDVSRCENGEELLEAVNILCDFDKNPGFFIRVFRRMFYSVTFFLLGAIFLLKSIPIFALPIKLLLHVPISYSISELIIAGICLISGIASFYGHHTGTQLL